MGEIAQTADTSLRSMIKEINEEIEALKIIQNELKGKISDLTCLFENHYHKKEAPEHE